MKISLKKILCLGMAIVMLVALAACGKDSSQSGNASGVSSNGSVIFKNEESVELGTPDVTLNPEEVYSKLTYTPEMFYGDYGIKGGRNVEESHWENSSYMTYDNGEQERALTVLPHRIKAGKNSLGRNIVNVTEYNWMELDMGFMPEGASKAVLYDVVCAYTVEGNKLILKPLKNYTTDAEKMEISYEFSDYVWEYEFSFSGRELTLSKDGESVVLSSCLDPHGEEDYYYTDCYLSEGSKQLDNIDYINMLSNNNGNVYIYLKTPDKVTSYTAVAKYEQNGLMTFTVPFEDGSEAKTYQYVAFFCEDDGMIFTDGINTYYYNDSYNDRNRRDVNKYISKDKTGQLSDEEIKEIVEKKDNLMDDLAKAFSDAGINVTVDAINGEIRMDSSILFGGDSAELSADGKAFLDKFLAAYTSIVFSEKYSGFIEKTMVEGHTAPLANSTYETGLPLSNERANTVRAYCVSSETTADTSRLATALEAVGMSNSKPVIDAYGNVDIDASRRVCFRFVINIG